MVISNWLLKNGGRILSQGGVWFCPCQADLEEVDLGEREDYHNACMSQAKLRHLQIALSPEQYLRLLETGRYEETGIFASGNASEEYWQSLPTYLIARCPFCGSTCTARVDTYSLEGGGLTSSMDDKMDGHVGCKHFVATQKFVNLNRQIPHNLRDFDIELDVPFVMPVFLRDDTPSFAVMHSLPLCEIERDWLPPFRRKFVPRYTIYTITYYSTSPGELWGWRRTEEAKIGKNDPEYDGTLLHTSFHAEAQPQSWDLRLWVRRGKLQWLDLSQDELPLKAGPPKEFPYAGIRGYRLPFFISKGKVGTPYPWSKDLYLK